MSNLYPVAGMKLYIGGVKAPQVADFVVSDFDAEVWTEIDGWSQMGPVGDAAALITTALINRGRDFKQKGTANAGSMANVFAVIRNDAGQIALRAAAAPANKNNYAFKVVGNDPTGSPATATTLFFIGLVTSAQEAGGEANTIQNLNATIEINSNIAIRAAGE
jgi:hypothetical protein